jgi:hypothetical protein
MGARKVRLPPSPLRGYGGPRKPDATEADCEPLRIVRHLSVAVENASRNAGLKWSTEN